MLTMNQDHSNADNEIAQLVPILVGSHTHTSKSLWWSLVRMVAQDLMQFLVSFNNVGKDSQVCNARSRPSKEISGVMQPRMSQNVESTKMLLLHNARETLAQLHNRRIRRLVHNLLSKNATTSIPSMLYVWCFDDMIQDDLV